MRRDYVRRVCDRGNRSSSFLEVEYSVVVAVVLVSDTVIVASNINKTNTRNDVRISRTRSSVTVRVIISSLNNVVTTVSVRI